jgi:hypothetical protein
MADDWSGLELSDFEASDDEASEGEDGVFRHRLRFGVTIKGSRALIFATNDAVAAELPFRELVARRDLAETMLENAREDVYYLKRVMRGKPKGFGGITYWVGISVVVKLRQIIEGLENELAARKET